MDSFQQNSDVQFEYIRVWIISKWFFSAYSGKLNETEFIELVVIAKRKANSELFLFFHSFGLCLPKSIHNCGKLKWH